MNKILVGLTVIAALSPALVPNFAHANTDGKSGGYIGGSIGNAEVDVPSDFKAFVTDNGGSIDDSDTGFKLFGGYRVNDYFAIEGFYSDFGEASIKFNNYKATSEASTLGVSLIGIVPATENFDLFAKIGLNKWDAEFKDTEGDSFDDDGSDPMYGIGVAYAFNQVSIRAEYEQYELEDEDVSLMSLGVAYHF